MPITRREFIRQTAAAAAAAVAGIPLPGLAQGVDTANGRRRSSNGPRRHAASAAPAAA